MRGVIVSLLVLLGAATAEAQSVAPAPSPTTPAHPALPWGIGIATPVGQLLRDVCIPSQQVVVDTHLPVPEAKPNGAMSVTTDAKQAEASERETTPQYMVWRQTATVPGYCIRQTTAGDYYPQRWTLEQMPDGAYRWRRLPAEVRGAR